MENAFPLVFLLLSNVTQSEKLQGEWEKWQGEKEKLQRAEESVAWRVWGQNGSDGRKRICEKENVYTTQTGDDKINWPEKITQRKLCHVCATWNKVFDKFSISINK